MRRQFLIIVVIGLLRSPAGAQDITGELVGALLQTQDALADWFARSLPLPSASAGVSYSFDPATGNFRRDRTTFGQIYLDRADPIGARRLNLSFAYQYVELDEIEGHDADDLRDPLPIAFEGFYAATQIPRLQVDAAVHEFLLAATYGISKNLDASLAVPVLYSDLHVRADVTVAAFTEAGTFRRLREHVDDPTNVGGFGDVLLRAKYRFLAWEDLHAATGLLLRLPTGEKEDLQGTGFFEVAPALLASSRIYEPAPWAAFQGHLNLTLGFNTDNVDSSEARWGIGLDWGITESITAAVAFLGRHPFARIGPIGSFDFTRCRTDLTTCAGDPSVRDTVAPLFGITGDRADYYNAAIGARGALWRDTVFAFASVAIPLNDGFVRTAPIPTVGVEGTF